MGERWVKEHYLSSVPADLAPFLRARKDESLQSLMGVALDLEADLKRSKPARNNPPTHALPQNPNRKPCEKCKRWKFTWDNCTNCG